MFTSAPVLIFPFYDVTFIIETNISNLAIGAILSQVSPKDSMVYIVAFFSRALTGPKCNNQIYDKELLAIVDSLDQ